MGRGTRPARKAFACWVLSMWMRGKGKAHKDTGRNRLWQGGGEGSRQGSVTFHRVAQAVAVYVVCMHLQSGQLETAHCQMLLPASVKPTTKLALILPVTQ